MAEVLSHCADSPRLVVRFCTTRLSRRPTRVSHWPARPRQCWWSPPRSSRQKIAARRSSPGQDPTLPASSRRERRRCRPRRRPGGCRNRDGSRWTSARRHRVCVETCGARLQQHAAHLSRNRRRLSAVSPVDAALIDQFQICLIDDACRLQRPFSPLASHIQPRDDVQSSDTSGMSRSSAPRSPACHWRSNTVTDWAAVRETGCAMAAEWADSATRCEGSVKTS